MIQIKNLFYSKEGRLFSIWRILRLFLVYGPLLHGFKYLFEKLFNLTIPVEYDALTIVVAVILTTLILDNEKLEWLGIELKVKSIMLFICGILWAYFFCVQIEIIGVLKSNTVFQLMNPFTKSAILDLAYYLFVIGLSEELLCRSYIISNVGRDTNIIIGLIVSTIVFTLIHFFSGSWGPWKGFHVGLVYGFVFTLLFGLTFIMTKNIFLAIGFHGGYDAFNSLFQMSFNIGMNVVIITVLFMNILIFYLIFKRILNFEIKTLLKPWP
jgi:hypothetical protein